MKQWGVLILLIFISNLAKAECYYSDSQVHLKLSTAEKDFEGYVEISNCIFNADSVGDLQYFLRVFSQNGEEKTLYLYQDIFTYRFCLEFMSGCADEEKLEMDVLLNAKEILLADIKAIEVLTFKNVPSFEYIISPVDSDNVDWMEEEADSIFSCHLDLCEYTIFVHQPSEKMNKVLSDIAEFQLVINDFELQDAFDQEKFDDLDRQLNRLLDQVSELPKVVLLVGCSD